MSKRALITGATGQDSSYLIELLLLKGYTVYGMVRRSSIENTGRIAHLLGNPNLHQLNGDMTDACSIDSAVRASKPDEIYNLAAMSQVRISFDIPASTADITYVGFARLLECVRKNCPDARVYQASSSEMFGKVLETPQTERTPFNPQSPYGIAKEAAFRLGRAYREGHGMHVVNGILFNHESPRRGSNFLSKKVVEAAVRIKRGQQDKLKLGNLDAKRDWGSAKEYVWWMWRMMQEPKAEDWLIATGETHSVEEFVRYVFELLDRDFARHVEFDAGLTRPTEVDLLQGNATKARERLGFDPRVKFGRLVRWMVDMEIRGNSPLDAQWPEEM